MPGVDGRSLSNRGVVTRRALRHHHGRECQLTLRDLRQPTVLLDVRILKTAGSSVTTEDVFALESNWKEKLGSRVTGLNRN